MANLTIWQRVTKALSSLYQARGNWYPSILESFPGAWQQNVEISRSTVLQHFAIFSCMTLIASDISKLRVKLTKKDRNGIWLEYENKNYSPAIKKPNHFQTRIQYWEHYILSKLSNGNVYVLKIRNPAGFVIAQYVLDPSKVKVLVSDSGEVFYRLTADNISTIEDDEITVPASEIIHDRYNCLHHPLIGFSPVTAAGLAATQGVNIQTDSINFFANRAIPAGLLVAPGPISDETADYLKRKWEGNFTGTKVGRLAVVGDGLKFEQLRINALDSQLIEQLKFTAEQICAIFHVPPYKIGIGALPSYNNIQALNVEYYSQALQALIESAELATDEGLELPENIGIEFDTDGLLRMDAATQTTTIRDSVGAGVMSPNEGRRKFNLKPVKGGDTPYLQQQNYSLSALDDRDRSNPLTAQPAQDNTPNPDANKDFNVDLIKKLCEAA